MTGIANRFGLHVGSVLDANNIDAKDVEKIHPGQVLLIPAADSNTSLAWLDEINAEKARLAREAEEARKKAERERLARLARSSQLTRNTSRSSVSSGVTVVGKIKFSSPYPYGWCTSYAAWKGGIPGGWGNAGSWYSSAKRAGWSVGQSPRAGAVFVSNESWVGHVGYVEAVYDDGSFLVSEMNYSGFGVVSKRVIHGTGNMIGFVYGR